MKQPVLATGLSNGTSNSTGTLNTVSDISASNAVGITTPRPLTILTMLFTKPTMHSPVDRNGVQRPFSVFQERYRETARLATWCSGKLTPPPPPATPNNPSRSPNPFTPWQSYVYSFGHYSTGVIDPFDRQ